MKIKMRKMIASSYLCNYHPNWKDKENMHYTKVRVSKMIWVPQVRLIMMIYTIIFYPYTILNTKVILVVIKIKYK